VIDLLTHDFGRKALVAAMAVGMAAPVVGAFLVQRRLSLIGDGIGHLALAGVALGVLFGISSLWGALAVGIIGAVALEALRTRGRLAGDLSLALIFYLGIAGGVVGLAAAGRYNASVLSVLFGSLFAMSWGDVILILCLCGGVMVLVSLLYKELLAVALDEETARAGGLPVDALNLVLVLLTAVLVVGGMRVVGLLLVAALMVVPVAAGARVSHSFRASLLWAVAVGAISVVAGLTVASVQGELVPGGTIVLSSIGIFVVFTLLGARASRRHMPGRAAR
jgi:zinc transport system permease protein